MSLVIPSKWRWVRSLPRIHSCCFNLIVDDVVRPLIRGQGMNPVAFVLVWLGIYIFAPDAWTAVASTWPLLTTFIVCWVAPLQDLSNLISLLGSFRAQSFHLLPHTYSVILITPEVFPKVLPYLPKLAMNLDKTAPLLGKTLEHKEHVLPLLEPVLENIDYMLPLVDVLVPHFDKIVPHGAKLLPHFKVLLPHAEAVAAHADALMPFLEMEGWEDALPYLEPLARNIDQLAPHAHILQDEAIFQKLRPKIPLMAQYLDNLIPVIDELAPHLPEVLPYMDMVPAKVQQEYLKSKVACKALPRMLKGFLAIKRSQRQLQPQKTPKLALPHYPMPENIGFKVKSFEKRVVNKSIVVYFRVSFTNDRCRHFRYSTLRLLHKRLKTSYERKYPVYQLPKFPSKSTFGKSLSEPLLHERAKNLEIYLNKICALPFILEEGVFQSFVQGFVISGMIPPEFNQVLETL